MNEPWLPKEAETATRLWNLGWRPPEEPVFEGDDQLPVNAAWVCEEPDEDTLRYMEPRVAWTEARKDAVAKLEDCKDRLARHHAAQQQQIAQGSRKRITKPRFLAQPIAKAQEEILALDEVRRTKATNGVATLTDAMYRTSISKPLGWLPLPHEVAVQAWAEPKTIREHLRETFTCTGCGNTPTKRKRHEPHLLPFTAAHWDEYVRFRNVVTGEIITGHALMGPMDIYGVVKRVKDEEDGGGSVHEPPTYRIRNLYTGDVVMGDIL